MCSNKKARISSVDALRGLAILFMILSNLITDLTFFGVMPRHPESYWNNFAIFTASLFIITSGWSLALSRRQNYSWLKVRQKLQLLLFWAFLITLTTILIIPTHAIRFGILHFFSVATLVGFLVQPYPKISLLLGLLCFMIPLSPHPLAVWLGLQARGFVKSVDYFPLNPYLGLFLISMALSTWLAPKNRASTIRRYPKLLLWSGRHSLAIYIIHQPILIGILALTGVLSLDQILGYK